MDAIQQNTIDSSVYMKRDEKKRSGRFECSYKEQRKSQNGKQWNGSNSSWQSLVGKIYKNKQNRKKQRLKYGQSSVQPSLSQGTHLDLRSCTSTVGIGTSSGDRIWTGVRAIQCLWTPPRTWWECLWRFPGGSTRNREVGQALRQSNELVAKQLLALSTFISGAGMQAWYSSSWTSKMGLDKTRAQHSRVQENFFSDPKPDGFFRAAEPSRAVKVLGLECFSPLESVKP